MPRELCRSSKLKRDGQPLPAERWRYPFANSLPGVSPTTVKFPALMAAFFRGFVAGGDHRAHPGHARSWTFPSGFPDDPRPLVDKHSTGGVGDKVSLAVSAAARLPGFRVPRSPAVRLGITGYPDKLDLIPGCQTLLPTERFDRDRAGGRRRHLWVTPNGARGQLALCLYAT